MKITIERNLLLNKLNLVAHALAVKSPMPVLTGVKMEVEGNNVTFVASNGDISIKTSLTYDEMTVEEEGAVVVSGKMFCDIIRSITAPNILLYTEDSTLRIEAGKGKYKLNIMDVSTYPSINFNYDEDMTPIKMNAGSFNDMVKSVITSTAQSEKKPILTGVNFNCSNNVLVAVATDSFRLSRMEMPFANSMDFNVTIPNGALNELMKCYDEKEEIEICIFKNTAGFKFADTTFITRLIDAQYPNTSKLIGTEFTNTLEFNKDELLNSVERVMVLSPTGSEKEKEISYNVVGLKQTNTNTAILEISNNHAGEAREEVALTVVDGENPVNIKFSGKYFTDALKTFKSDKVRLKFNGEVRPFVIEGDNDKGLIQLILPVRM